MRPRDIYSTSFRDLPVRPNDCSPPRQERITCRTLPLSRWRLTDEPRQRHVTALQRKNKVTAAEDLSGLRVHTRFSPPCQAHEIFTSLSSSGFKRAHLAPPTNTSRTRCSMNHELEETDPFMMFRTLDRLWFSLWFSGGSTKDCGSQREPQGLGNEGYYYTPSV